MGGLKVCECYCLVYDFPFWIMFGGDRFEAVAKAKKIFEFDSIVGADGKPDDGKRKADTSKAFVITEPNSCRLAFWFRDPEPGYRITAHEVTHAVLHVCRQIPLPLIPEAEESICYLHEYFTHEIAIRSWNKPEAKQNGKTKQTGNVLRPRTSAKGRSRRRNSKRKARV